MTLAALGLVVLGIRDSLQQQRSVLRNYPVIGHLRFLLEYIRPELRQYFIESDNEETPFSRQQRSIVYQRAKVRSDKRPFGTQLDQHARGLRVDQPFARADADSDRRLPRHRRLGAELHEAVQHQHLQRVGDELRRAVGQRDPRRSTAAPRRAGFAHDTGEGRSARTTGGTAAI